MNETVRKRKGFKITLKQILKCILLQQQIMLFYAFRQEFKFFLIDSGSYSLQLKFQYFELNNRASNERKKQ